MSVTEQDVLEVIEPSSPTLLVSIGGITYEQKPLSFFGKMELFALLGKAIDRAMSGEDALDIGDLLEIPSHEEGEKFTVEDLKDSETFIKAFAKVIEYAPDLMGDVYCIALGVPRGRRETVKGVMSLPVDEGGLSDSEGIAVFETFVDQNAAHISAFFVDQLLPALRRAGKKLDVVLTPSKPSNRSARRTGGKSKK